MQLHCLACRAPRYLNSPRVPWRRPPAAYGHDNYSDHCSARDLVWRSAALLREARFLFFFRLLSLRFFDFCGVGRKIGFPPDRPESSEFFKAHHSLTLIYAPWRCTATQGVFNEGRFVWVHLIVGRLLAVIYLRCEQLRFDWVPVDGLHLAVWLRAFEDGCGRTFRSCTATEIGRHIRSISQWLQGSYWRQCKQTARRLFDMLVRKTCDGLFRQGNCCPLNVNRRRWLQCQ